MNVSLEVYPPQEWTDEDRILTEMAKAIMEKAHAPYSDFLVGAALLLDNGEMYAANNQENVSFPVGVCAERAVLSYAVGNRPQSRPVKIIIAAKKRLSERYATVTPCGLCRQTINEYEIKFNSPIQIMMLHPDGDLLVASSVETLLPFRFNDLNA